MKILICEFGLILFFFFWFYLYSKCDHLEFHVNMEELWIFIMMHEKAYYFYVTEVYKRFRGLSLLMKWEGWIGKIFSVRWAWGKMRSVFYITWPLTLLMHLLAEENKAIHFIQGSAQLPLDHSAFNWFEYYSPWVTLWCGFYRWGRSCAQEIKKVYQTDRKCSF